MESYTRSRTIQLPERTQLNEEIVREFDNLFSSIRPSDLRNTLIEIYHSYVIHEHQAFPVDFDRMSVQMYLLIDLLKRVEAQMEKPYPSFEDEEVLGEVQEVNIIWLLKGETSPLLRTL